MVQVGVQRASQRRPPVDQANPRMTPAMDPALVPLGLAKPSFQVQIVSWQLIDRAQEQSREKAGHQFGHVLGKRVLLLDEALAELLELTATVFWGARSRIERIGHGLDLLYLRPHIALNLLDRLQPAVNAVR